MDLLKIIGQFWTKFFWPVQKFLILSKNFFFFEKFNKITSKVPKMVYKEAFIQLSVIFSFMKDSVLST